MVPFVYGGPRTESASSEIGSCMKGGEQVSIESVMAEHEDHILGLPNVVGIGIGERDGEPVIKVFVSTKVPESALQPEDTVPKSLGDWATDVEEIGIVTAQDD